MYQYHGTGNWHFYELHHDPKDIKCVECLVGAKESIIEESVKIFHPNLVKIGKGSYVGNEVMLKGYPLNGSDTLPSITIGDNCWIGERVYIHGAGHVKIGDRVGIGPGVMMLTSYHDSRGNDSLLDQPLNFKPIRIDEGADIEAGAFICAGVTIGKGAIVRAGSVVTKIVGDYEIFQGNPATFHSFRESNEAHFQMRAL